MAWRQRQKGFGKGRVDERGWEESGEREELLSLLEFGLITKAMDTCGQFVDKRARDLISKLLVMQSGRTWQEL